MSHADLPPLDWLLVHDADNVPLLLSVRQRAYVKPGPALGTLFVSFCPFLIRGDIDELAIILNATRYTPA